MDIMFRSDGRFFIATDNGHLVGMASCIPYSKCGWIGNVVVRRDERRRGIGMKVTQACMDYLRSKGVRPALFAYSVSKRMYQRMGYVECGEYVDHCGYMTGQNLEKGTVSNVDAGDLKEISRFDLEMWGDDRGKLLCHMAECATVLSCKSDRGLEGYIMGTLEKSALYVGPWVARSAPVARSLFTVLVERAMKGKDPLYVDASVPSSNTDASTIFDGMLKPVDRVAEMHADPKGIPERKGVYACASLDKG
jgi:hypothetical protein